ncbi:MAG: SPASM domain-containing protein [Armatimonadetes bacterium]|nr:SPASM domain-containing protein [Armatimonadota bacterium]
MWWSRKSLPDLDDFLKQLFQENMLLVNARGIIPEDFKYSAPAPLPSFFSLHIAEGCNFQCNYCYVDSPSKGKRMTLETGKKIMNLVSRLPVHFGIIQFHGGEPLLNFPLITELVPYIHSINRQRENPFRIAVQSNGSLLDPEKAAFFVENRIMAGISVDGPQEIHDRHRIFRNKSGTHASVMKGVAACREAGLFPGVGAVLHEPDELVEVSRFLLDQGWTSFHLNPLACHGRGKNLRMDDAWGERLVKAYLELIDILLDRQEQLPPQTLDVWDVNVLILHLISPSRPFMCMRSPCGAGNTILGFSAAGDIYSCEEMIGRSEFILGNVHNVSDLQEVLSGERNRWVMSRRVENIPACRNCTWRGFCGGGCAGKAHGVFDDLFREDPNCGFLSRVFPEIAWKVHRDKKMMGLLGKLWRHLVFPGENRAMAYGGPPK